MKKININNKQVKLILEYAQTMDFGNKCRAKGFQPHEYEFVSKYSVSDTYLEKRVAVDNINIEFAYNMIIGESEGGKYFLNSLKPILNYGNYYTSGYYPHGFVGWHDDVDIFGYYIMFSYCTSDAGYFKYRDIETKNLVTNFDKKGWIASGVKLGHEKKDALWHCAYTETPRYTFLLHYNDETEFEKAIGILENE